jgi:hypothetical protein
VIDLATVDAQLRQALIARAHRLGLDPATVTSPSPGALVARSRDGGLLRVDFRTYSADELGR